MKLILCYTRVRMRWLDALERRFGTWTIPQFPLFIVFANALLYVMSALKPGFAERMILDPSAVYAGEVWRLFTFLFISPPMGMIGMFFWLGILYFCAAALESQWGEFQFLFFYLVGWAATVAVALGFGFPIYSNGPLNTTLFFAFATLAPNFEVYLFLILPVRAKWIAWIYALFTVWEFVAGTLSMRVEIGASLVNYIIFFGPDVWNSLRLRAQVWRNRRRFRG